MRCDQPKNGVAREWDTKGALFFGSVDANKFKTKIAYFSKRNTKKPTIKKF